MNRPPNVPTMPGQSVILSLVGLLLLTAMPFAPAAAQQATPAAVAETITISGAVTQETMFTVADLQAFPAAGLAVTYESGGEPESHTYTGTSLFGVIEAVGLDVPEDARNPLLQTYLIVTAKDGYQVVISGGELDPNFGNASMYLAWEQDGAPLTGDDGPVRLVALGDLRGGRYVFGIVSIEVVRLSGSS